MKSKDKNKEIKMLGECPVCGSELKERMKGLAQTYVICSNDSCNYTRMEVRS